ncbi:MAG: hypothetical protein ABI406_03385, partial [Ktedonobacteraceae bacterium]
ISLTRYRFDGEAGIAIGSHEQVIRARDEWRRKGVRAITQQLVEKQLLSTNETFDEIVNILFTLTSFETFDTLAGTTRNLEEVAPVVQHLAHAAIGLT